MAIKIYIDQGHNPVAPNSGAEGNGYREQDIVFRIGVLLSEILESRGFETRLSRPTQDTQLGNSNQSALRARVDGANSFGADYFISLHTNAAASASASGTEALVYREPSRASRLASSILEDLTLATGLRNRGIIERPGLYVLRKTTMPAVLVELGFISNQRDADLMANSPRLFAEGIADGITNYLAVSGSARAVAAIPDDDVTEAAPDEEILPDNLRDYRSYEDFLSENDSSGRLRVQAFRGRGAFPVPNVRVVVSHDFGDGEKHVFFSGLTDENGIIDDVVLPAPPKENSLEFGAPDKLAIYDARIDGTEFETADREVEIFEGVKTILPLNMTLKEELE